MSLERRDFLKGAAVAGAAAVAAGLTGCATADSQTQTASAADASYMPESWDKEADFVIIGCGAAGISAAVTATEEGFGDAIIIDKAPEDFAGGNSRVCAQLLFIPKDVEGAIKYQTALNGPYDAGEELTRAWAEAICENYDWLTDLGAELEISTVCNPEFGDVEGSEVCETYLHEGVLGKSTCWEWMKEIAEDNGTEIMYETPATGLVYEPATREVYGVVAEQGGKTIYLKAKKAVIMAAGGFENNPEMIKDYFAIGYFEPGICGSPYNTGDGIKICEEIGCELVNMNNFALQNFGAKVESQDSPIVRNLAWPTKDYIFVGPDSKRFMYEETENLTKHGKMRENGVYVQVHLPRPAWAIFGQACFDAGTLFPKAIPWQWPLIGGQAAYDNQGMVDAGMWFKADSARELAGMIGLDPDKLEKTINEYNANAVAGVDPDYKRGQDFMYNFSGHTAGSTGGEDTEEGMEGSVSEDYVAIEAFDLVPIEPPFYAFGYYSQILNSQGGPKRTTKGELVRAGTGEVIPRLYGAGEMGTIYRYQYNGGGNFSDAIATGRLAARGGGALEPWDA